MAGLAAAIVASCVAYLPVVYSILALLKRSMASGGELEEDSQIHGRQEDLGGPESETGHVAAVSRAPSDLPGTHACTVGGVAGRAVTQAMVPTRIVNQVELCEAERHAVGLRSRVVKASPKGRFSRQDQYGHMRPDWTDRRIRRQTSVFRAKPEPRGKEARRRSAIYPGTCVCQGPGVIYTYLPGRLCHAPDARIRS